MASGDTGYGLHWFRRDLRILGNPALEANFSKHSGRVLGVFFIDEQILGRSDFSPARFLFLLKTLKSLREEMIARGGDLLILEHDPVSGLRPLIQELAASDLGVPSTVSWNRDYEPFARERDERMLGMLDHMPEIEVITERDHLLIEPHELLKDDSTPYQVFSPFRNRWLKLLADPETQHRLKLMRRWLDRGPPEFRMRLPADFSLRRRSDEILTKWISKLEKQVTLSLPKVGISAAFERLDRFRDEWLDQYATSRDRPGVPGTSQMSIYLKNGTVTVPQIICSLNLDRITATENQTASVSASASESSPLSHQKYREELLWREFFYHLLHHYPRVATEPFQKNYAALQWKNSEKLFEAWCEGRTGYPIVDAGMRQLRATGWMHNRLRMITASFLTKDLLIDWKWGERFFMQHLLDGDLAANNGGWQWAASTGADAQPYFRIFNPMTQGLKFDPDGEFLRHWAPEYLGRKRIHEPVYPVVDHAVQREAALALYDSVRGNIV